MLSGGRKNNTRLITMQDAERVVNCLTYFTEEHAMILPGRIPGYKRDDLRLLPSCHTKASIHRLYEQSMIAIGDRSICCNSFRQLWKTLLPHIVVARPMTDLCWECQKNNASIARTSNLPEIVKSAKLRKQEDHFKIVHQERQIYKDMVRKHKDAFEFTSEKPTLRQHLPCTSDIRGHYSFDFAQQVHLPSNPLQPGPMYFLCPRKCGIFGVCCEGLPCQVNYLVDEAHCTSKGSNAVISFLDHFFDNYALGENNIDLHCDNCPGQNKNKYMMMYLMWRILTGKHQDISINFLITGHTKCAPDWCFGLLKQKFRKTEVSCLDDLAKCVEASTVTGVNHAQLVGTESGEVFIPQYNWHTFLEPYFRTIPGIKSYHHLRFVASRPGVVAVKEFANSSEKEFVLLKDLECSVPTEKPTPQKPPGLSRERQSYLLDHIREFVRQDVQDVLCPRFE